MTPLNLGSIEITRIVESEGETSPRFLFPEITPEHLKPYLEWLTPHFYTPETDRFNMAVQAFVVRTPHHTMLVDTCVGNDKKRTTPNWNMLNGPFLADLKAAGVDPSEVDYVMCTHLHVDHVGWNTRLVDGKWQPTFPRAKYIFNKQEYEFWCNSDDEDQAETFRDSVLPIMEEGLAELVDGDHEIVEGIHLEPTPGHTPGHCSLHLTSTRGEAVITGDMMHHPVQMLNPEQSSRFCNDAAQARATRRTFLERYSDRDVRLIGTHFYPPTHGHVVPQGEGWRLKL